MKIKIRQIFNYSIIYKICKKYIIKNIQNWIIKKINYYFKNKNNIELEIINRNNINMIMRFFQLKNKIIIKN